MKEIGSVISDVTNVASETLEGAKLGAQIGGPIGAAVGATLGLVSSLSKVFAAKHDKGQEREIQKLQKQVEILKETYNSLEKSIDKAYSSSAAKLIRENDEVLKQQKKLIEAQIKAEESKKKTDKNF